MQSPFQLTKSIADVGTQLKSAFDAIMHFRDSLASRTQKKEIARVFREISYIHSGSEVIMYRISSILKLRSSSNRYRTEADRWLEMQVRLSRISPRLDTLHDSVIGLEVIPLRPKSEIIRVIEKCRELNDLILSCTYEELQSDPPSLDQVKGELGEIMDAWYQIDEALREDFDLRNVHIVR